MILRYFSRINKFISQKYTSLLTRINVLPGNTTWVTNISKTFSNHLLLRIICLKKFQRPFGVSKFLVRYKTHLQVIEFQAIIFYSVLSTRVLTPRCQSCSIANVMLVPVGTQITNKLLQNPPRKEKSQRIVYLPVPFWKSVKKLPGAEWEWRDYKSAFLLSWL